MSAPAALDLQQIATLLREHDAKLGTILGRLEAALAPAPTVSILTRPEARAHVKRASEAAFCMWCRRWRVRPCSRGRYSRLALDQALDREARAGRRPTARAA